MQRVLNRRTQLSERMLRILVIGSLRALLAPSIVLALLAAACGSYYPEPAKQVPFQNSDGKASENIRITSPNGQLDAVLVTYTYGPAAGGGVDSNVYIVRKGSPVTLKLSREVFRADPMTHGNLVWKQDHLLEIHYDVANIHMFRNTWGLDEVEDVGSAGQHDFNVEVKLMPMSDTSAIRSDGSFRN